MEEEDLKEENGNLREIKDGLQEAGEDPFEITKYNQTHHSEEIKKNFGTHKRRI